MNFSHTPGPWIKQTNDSGNQIRITDSATEGRTIAMLSAEIRFGLHKGDTQEENQANASLISAAPDMLAALQAFITMEADYPHIKHGHLFMNARAALVKARG